MLGSVQEEKLLNIIKQVLILLFFELVISISQKSVFAI